jgi:hypothetical protein
VAKEVANMLAVSIDINTSDSKMYVDIPAVSKTLFAKTFSICRPNIKCVVLIVLQMNL